MDARPVEWPTGQASVFLTEPVSVDMIRRSLKEARMESQTAVRKPTLNKKQIKQRIPFAR
ncbi:hypothetical protein BGZ79_001029, partial [Entomortierella chlamydospora]